MSFLSFTGANWKFTSANKTLYCWTPWKNWTWEESRYVAYGFWCFELRNMFRAPKHFTFYVLLLCQILMQFLKNRSRNAYHQRTARTHTIQYASAVCKSIHLLVKNLFSTCSILFPNKMPYVSVGEVLMHYFMFDTLLLYIIYFLVCIYTCIDTYLCMNMCIFILFLHLTCIYLFNIYIFILHIIIILTFVCLYVSVHIYVVYTDVCTYACTWM